MNVVGKSGQAVNGLRVYCQPKVLSDLRLSSSVIAAPGLSSPSTIMLFPGIYVCWAANDGEPSVPVSNKVDVGISGGESNLNLFVRIP